MDLFTNESHSKQLLQRSASSPPVEERQRIISRSKNVSRGLQKSNVPHLLETDFRRTPFNNISFWSHKSGGHQLWLKTGISERDYDQDVRNIYFFIAGAHSCRNGAGGGNKKKTGKINSSRRKVRWDGRRKKLLGQFVLREKALSLFFTFPSCHE